MNQPPRQRPSEVTALAVAQSAGELATLASQQMEANLGWYRDLSAQERSQVGLVAQAGISQFIEWFHHHEGHAPSAISIFANAPQELTRSVNLRQTLDLVRTVVDVVESRVESLAGPGDEQLLRESVLRFSREIAFAAAEVYAGAAEARGAWDARLEALVVDAVLRGEADESMQSRATALGWGEVADVTFVVGATPIGRGGPGGAAAAVDELRRALRHHGVESLAIVQRTRLIAIIGGTREPVRVLEAVRTERALAGDGPARRALVDRVHRPLSLASQGALLDTATAYLECGGSLEATARMLFVHANTVRYRVARIAEVTGYDLGTPREAWAVRMGLALGRLGASTPGRGSTPVVG